MTSAARPGAGRRPAKGRIKDMADGEWRMAEGQILLYSPPVTRHPSLGRGRRDVAGHCQPAPAQDSSHHQAGNEPGQDTHEQSLAAQRPQIAWFYPAFLRDITRKLLAPGGPPGQFHALSRRTFLDRRERYLS